MQHRGAAGFLSLIFLTLRVGYAAPATAPSAGAPRRSRSRTGSSATEETTQLDRARRRPPRPAGAAAAAVPGLRAGQHGRQVRRQRRSLRPGRRPGRRGQPDSIRQRRRDHASKRGSTSPRSARARTLYVIGKGRTGDRRLRRRTTRTGRCASARSAGRPASSFLFATPPGSGAARATRTGTAGPPRPASPRAAGGTTSPSVTGSATRTRSAGWIDGKPVGGRLGHGRPDRRGAGGRRRRGLDRLVPGRQPGEQLPRAARRDLHLSRAVLATR